MTWLEFKQLLEKRNVRDDEEIEYVDVSYPARGYEDEIHIKRTAQPDGAPFGVQIWS